MIVEPLEPIEPEEERLWRYVGPPDDEAARLARLEREREAQARAAAAEEHRRQADEARRRQAIEKFCGIPTTDAFDAVRPKPWIGGFLYGPAGVGKTHEAICRVLSVPLGSGVFVGVLEYLDQARDKELGRLDGFRERRLCTIRKAEHLVLDDIGLNRVTPLSLEALYRLVDARWQTKAETLVTSNLTPKELASLLGDRIASRVLAQEFGPRVEMTGEDRRLRGRS